MQRRPRSPGRIPSAAPRRPRRVPLAILAIMVGMQAGCREAPPAPEHVILLSLDTLRRDAVGAYRQDRPSITPSLDDFARESVVFENARAQMPFTQPSHMSMFTGLYPGVHGVIGAGSRLSAEVSPLAELLQRAGFRTAGLAVNAWMHADFGFGRGFDDYRVVWGGATHAEELNHAALGILEAAKRDGARLFLFVQHFDPHSDDSEDTQSSAPYFAPGTSSEESAAADYCLESGECASRYLAWADARKVGVPAKKLREIHGLYEDGVRHLDGELRRFFDALRALDVYDRSLIIVTSDHGEEFREHGRFLHSQPYEETLALPLLVRFPGGRFAGQRRAELVETVDFLPTILDALGLDIPEIIQGRSLLPLLAGGGPLRTHALGRDKSRPGRYALAGARYKLIHDYETGRSELYDLEEDPGETLDRSQGEPRRVEEMRRVLDERLRANRKLAEELRKAAKKAPQPGSVLSDDEKARLEALGYLEE
jgi:arylsulfatase A-like enzyme